MLKQRVLTAAVLLAILAAALAAPSPWPLSLILSLAAACGLWEWLRLTWPVPAGRAPLVLALLAAALMVTLLAGRLSTDPLSWAQPAWSLLLEALVPAAALGWLLIASFQVRRGDVQTSARSIWLSLAGVAAMLAAWAALIQAWLHHGGPFLLSLMALVWLADIAAYFVGRAIGRRKLAPRVSPGKSVEGALGGIAAAVLWTLACMAWPGTFGAVLAQHLPWPVVALAAALLAALSIVGDLYESLLKRRAGVKDSSQLLPGHGGVYDRIDALLPVAPAALWLLSLWPT